MGNLDTTEWELAVKSVVGSWKRDVTVYVNGKKYVVYDAQPETTLLQWLRGQGYTGTKLGCGEGGCGACTVLLSHYNSWESKIIHRSVNACLTPFCAVDGMAVITVEGLGSIERGLHPIQDRMARSHGSQCGFCTPGIVMAMYALLRNHPKPTRKMIEEALDGNLCRCTGYRPILDAFKSFAIDADEEEFGPNSSLCDTESSTNEKRRWHMMENKGAATGSGTGLINGSRICPGSGKPCSCGDPPVEELGRDSKFEPYIPDAEPIFPPALMLNDPEPIVIKGQKATWFKPTNLADLLKLKELYPTAKLIVGNSEIGIEMKFKNAGYPTHISTAAIRELNEVKDTPEGLVIGGSVTIQRIWDTIKQIKSERPEYETECLRALESNIKWFAGTQIRSVASIAGNIVTASPISDLNPVHMAAGTTFKLLSTSGDSRQVPARDFFLSYRKTELKPNEILLSISVPYSRKYEYMEAYKQARRRDDDIAIVNAAYRVALTKGDEGEWIVTDMSLAYGGMAPLSICAKKSEALLIGKPWNERTLQDVMKTLEEDLPLSPNAPGGMIEYRRTLTTSFFFKFFWLVMSKLEQPLPSAYASLVAPFHRPVSHGLQHFDLIRANNGQVGRPVRHMAGELHVTGEAIYVDDMPNPKGCLYAAFVISTRGHAKIVSIDASMALTSEGVEGFFSAKDVPGTNKISTASRTDEEVFVSDEVTAAGLIVGVVVADTESHAQAGARLVRVKYEDLPTVLTIQEAIAADSFHFKNRKIECGEVDTAMSNSDVVVQGEIYMGGQEHFYLETHTMMCVPGENNEFTVYASSQNPTKTQFVIGEVLGVEDNRVVCKVKRLGGGFGGKETRGIPMAAACAVAAKKLNRPVRIMLDRDVDMAMKGSRHPFYGQYKAGFSRDGLVQALDLTLYNNGGHSLDLSLSIMDRALQSSDNGYYIPNVRVVGHVCKTNLPSNTAFRGFGGPQGLFIAETWMDHAARELGMPPAELREKNLYREGEITHYGMELDGCHLRDMWSQVIESSDFYSRRQAIEEYNKTSAFKKRGISINPVNYGVSPGFVAINQAGAHVLVYQNGSVLLSHSGTEMGQGLHVKCAQIAADAFGIPLAKVYVSETSTDKVPNTSPTAGSIGSDVNGFAVLDACNIINERLKPIREKMPDASWFDITNAAYMQRINLAAQGFYMTPGIGYDWNAGKGKPFYYHAYGVAVTEVEVDALTGDHMVLRTDIIHDVGQSLNPAVDIGQIEGAFVQGMGLYTLEERVWMSNGAIFTRGPSTYKIPSFNDIPIDFRTSLLKNAPLKKTIHSSKAVGEPPLALGATVYFAVKDAIYSRRSDLGKPSYFRLDSPATCERIRMSCEDDLTSQFAPENYHPVNYV
mmetsp:Transcript_34636/g.58034  ORF Transcript_34636/g.58034 Transcript_34636/m.58034 type:complete len:1370 (-) Transcript_34636:596-4705(-)